MFVIPLGGSGVRFRENGYVTPKGLVPLHGKPMIFYLLECLPPNAEVLIVCHPDYINQDLEALVKSNFTMMNVTLRYLSRPTQGAAETLMMGLIHVNDDTPVLCLDGDTYYKSDVVRRWSGDNSVFVFHDHDTNPIFSYVEIRDSRVVRIAEKNRISNTACVGAYGFRSVKLLREACERIIVSNRRDRGEFYTSTVIQQLLDDGEQFSPCFLQQGEWFCVGTPLQLRIESLTRHDDEKYRFCFDVDHTLVHCSPDYKTWTPILRNVSFLRFLFAEGHTIILHTARRMRTHHGNLGKVLADVGSDTLKMLEELEIPYHELVFGKPHAHFYIDDLGVNARHDLQKATGFYSNEIEPRAFHTLSVKDTKIIRKSGDVKSQIHYYLNIPASVRFLFPSMTDYADDFKWYEMQFVHGLPFSQLYVSELMTESHLAMLMQQLDRLHTNESNCAELNIYDNYTSKLTDRFQNNKAVYDHLPDSDTAYNEILRFLTTYETESLGSQGMIHGDAVFTNVLLVANDRIKFIDMRGKVGSQDTIYGDILYDYAKVYQSLIGYDETLLRVRVPESYRQRMIRVFHAHIGDRIEYVAKIASSLLFTLIPLHQQHHSEFFELCQSLLKYPITSRTES